MNSKELSTYLKGGLFISSMMFTTDGDWVARRGEGARMVQIGALIADSQDHSHDPRCLLPQDHRFMVSILRRELEIIRQSLGNTPVALNAAPGDLDSAVKMASAFSEAGGDIFELNCHGAYKKLLDKGLLSAMVLPRNRVTMYTWLEKLCTLDIPVVVKFNSKTEGVEFGKVLRELEPLEKLFGIHFNIQSKNRKEPNLDFVRSVKPYIKGTFFCSGYVVTRQQVDALLAEGVDCAGVAQGLLDNPRILIELSQ